MVVELSHQSIIYRAHLGQVMPISAGAAAKVFLATEPSVLSAVMEDPESMAQRTIANRDDLEAELVGIRRRGWAHTDGERELGLSSISAPIRDGDGNVVAALSIGGPSLRFTSTFAERCGSVVTSRALLPSSNLGEGTAAAAEAGALLIREASRVLAAPFESRQLLHGPMEAASHTSSFIVIGADDAKTIAGSLDQAGHQVFVFVEEGREAEIPAHLPTVSFPGNNQMERAVFLSALFQRLAGSMALLRNIDPDDFLFLDGAGTKVTDSGDVSDVFPR